MHVPLCIFIVIESRGILLGITVVLHDLDLSLDYTVSKIGSFAVSSAHILFCLSLKYLIIMSCLDDNE